MKKTLLASCFLLASAVLPAMAADDIVTQPGFDWSGAYVGVDGGYSWFEGADSFGGQADFDGFLGGLHVGYNVMFDNILLGAEVDGAITNADVTSVFNIETSANWLTSARIRAGFAADRVLFYATGGVSAGGLELTNIGPGITDKNTHVGWVIGAGVEAFVTDTISARLEYQHHEFGKETYNIGGANFEVDGNVDLIKFGVSYHF
ncbi:outer membrane protein [Hoeflea olei]|uniref:Outer membrane protein beta-barrel domain-containing protein n=1 Tax=Hoeflea olei TaxID=1480615 RepID=A0A1C1YZV8_9HYPH|nr:outer membrane protein [Hoeflea olei]OCW59012.1 hypothetical protein AWJ14_04705 [Hoeflea olei]